MKVAQYISVIRNGGDKVTHTCSKCAKIDILKTYLFIFIIQGTLLVDTFLQQPVLFACSVQGAS